MMKMYQVDAFTKTLFNGNSAAVIILSTWPDAAVMQNIALENNLSETAFVVSNGDDSYHIRWFTPTNEVEFCGHATLASAFILFRENHHLTQLRFTTNDVGDFYIRQQSDGRIDMDFPIREAQPLSDIPLGLQAALVGEPFKAVYLNDQAYLVEYACADHVRALKPNFIELQKIGLAAKSHYGTTRDIVVTAPDEHSDFDCISRYFAPAIGVNEDPVTGSIYTAVAPFWLKRMNRSELVAYQASERGGVLYCKQLSPSRIQISGYAVLYMTAEIFL